MDIKPIKTENDYNISIKRIEELWGAKKDSAEGDELDLLDLYQALNLAVQAGQIQQYELLYLNGYHKDYFIYGDKIIKPDFEIVKSIETKILNTQNIRTVFEGKNQITMNEFIDLIYGLFSSHIATTAFLTYIALFLGNNFWKNI